MEGLVPIHRLKQGKVLFNSGKSLPFLLGLVFRKNGVFFVELHFPESINLDLFYKKNEYEFYSTDYVIESTTSDSCFFHASKISLKSFPFHKSMGDFYCHGELTLRQKDEYYNMQYPKSHGLKYVHLEGVRRKYGEHSKNLQVRSTEKIPRLFSENGWRDCEEIKFSYRDREYYFLMFDFEEKTVLDFCYSDDFEQHLSYELWKSFRLEFLEFLSFLNGAKVIVREEHFGDYYTPRDLKAEVSVYHSIETNKPRRWNDFMAINNLWYLKDRIVKRIFQDCFHTYIEKNLIWDLNTIIFYLSNSEETPSLGDKIFVQTILLEKLSSSYAETLMEEWVKVIPDEEFEVIKNELQNVLEKKRNSLTQQQFNILNGRIIGLNKGKRKAYDVKFRNLLNALNIEVSDSIESLLLKRHKYVHYAEIGSFDQALQDYSLIDTLIRTIIVQIIQYKGATIQEGRHYDNAPEPMIKLVQPNDS